TARRQGHFRQHHHAARVLFHQRELTPAGFRRCGRLHDPGGKSHPMTDIAGMGHALVLGPLIVLSAALVSAGLIVVLAPWLKAYALARPNARSSHRAPTPQGGGAAVVVAAFAAAWGGSAL